MTTPVAAFNILRARLEGASLAFPLRFPNEDGAPLPDVATAFAYVDWDVSTGGLASFGGGRGANRYRVYWTLSVFVFVPRSVGLDAALTRAETVAALFRSYRSGDVSCSEATVRPGQTSGAGLKPPMNEVENYFWAVAIAHGFFDQIG